MKRQLAPMASIVPIAALLSALFFSTSVQAASEQDLQNSFDPYLKGFPQFPGVTHGLVIDKRDNSSLTDAVIAMG